VIEKWMTFLAIAQSTDLLEDAGVRDLVEFYVEESQIPR
jgi:hypothetical protein